MTQVRWDHDRESRTGVPEVIFGPGKTAAHLRQAFENTAELRMASRLSPEQKKLLEDYARVSGEEIEPNSTFAEKIKKVFK